MSTQESTSEESAATEGIMAAAARGVGYAVTNLIKLGGLAVAVNESLIRTELRPIAMAVAAVMMAGAQGVESFLEKLFGR